MFNRMLNFFIANKSNRDKWIKEKVSQIESNKKILDAGCGQQPYRKHCDKLKYYSQDFNQYTGEGDGLQVKDWEYGKLDYIGNIWEIKEEDNFFDTILCTEVIEHIPYPNETIAEFSRLLKKNGTLILTAPYASLPHFEPYFYYSGFSKYWFTYTLVKFGFEVVEITPNGNFFKFLIQESLRGANIIKNPIIKIFPGFN
jgi:2-polyprenyl-3-methyl-5-hydroxy-6-metoxy-1,4-benzoquinol methylase